MEQRIIGLSGRKQSGKNTCCNLIIGWEMLSLGLTYNIKIKDGMLWVSDILGDTNNEGLFDITRDNTAMKIFKEENLNQFVKLYSFADLLKKGICMNVLGLTRDQCYGTDEEKNSETNIKWENLPSSAEVRLHEDERTQEKKMTGREVMQYVGTDVFRKMYPNVWVDATVRKIKEDGAYLALICDCRFPNEVEGVQEAGGKVIRLTKNGDDKDSHFSETALDKENYDWNNFDAIIDNKDMEIGKQNEALYLKLNEWSWNSLDLPL
tara:strand:- start:393 stop:1187 length:795 start_codon:yes stop_codon:yes gene_type:complete